MTLDQIVNKIVQEGELIETQTEYVIYTWESLEIKLHLHDGDCYMISGRNRR